MKIEVKKCKEENCIVEQAEAINEFCLQSIFFYNATTLQLDLLSRTLTQNFEVEGVKCSVTIPQKLGE